MVILNQPDEKLGALRASGAVTPHPEAVTDPLFLGSDFLDPRDLVQVKYEMVRRVQVEGQTVSQVVKAFGFSRPTFYQARAALAEAGLPGLLPRRRGPQHAHKLRAEVLDFLVQTRAADPTVTSRALVPRIQERFGVVVHPRTIERGLARRQKRGALRPH